MEQIEEKERLFRSLLIHPKIKKIHGRGLMLALELDSPEYCLQVAKECMSQGLIVFWQLYKTNFLRLSPPLTLSKEEITYGSKIILKALSTS